MSEVVWSIIKYKPKAGCQDEFKIKWIGSPCRNYEKIQKDKTANAKRRDQTP